MNDPLHIVCPHCDAINRLPGNRLGQNPNCGQCHQALFTAHPVELTGINFERQVMRSGIPVLVDFWAPWCGPCKMMAPAFAEAAGLLEPYVRLAKLDSEAEQVTASRFSIRSIPTLALFRHGKEIARQAGAMGVSDIVRWARAHLQ